MVVICCHSHRYQASDESCMQEMYSIFLQRHEWYWSQVTSQPTRVLSAVLERIFSRRFLESRPSCHFRTLTAYNKKTKTNFQKLISKPFSTCLNLSNKLNLWKRCSWPLIRLRFGVLLCTYIFYRSICKDKRKLSLGRMLSNLWVRKSNHISWLMMASNIFFFKLICDKFIWTLRQMIGVMSQHKIF